MQKIQLDECVLYWAHLDTHNCIGSDGYVGISTNFKSRVLSHRSSSKNKKCRQYNTRFYKALRKYGSAVKFDIIYQSSISNCLYFENLLRPNIDTGWNHAIGGDKPLVGLKISDATRLAMSLRMTGKVVPESTRNKISLAAKARGVNKKALDLMLASRHLVKPWNSGKQTTTTLYLWSIADQIYNSILFGNSERVIESLLYLRKSSAHAVVAKINNGLIPNDDGDWITFKKNYLVIREHQKLKVKEYKHFNTSNCLGDNVGFWAIADDMFSYWESKRHGKRKMSSKFSMDNINLADAFINKFKKGWIPQEDPDWLAFREKYNTENTA